MAKAPDATARREAAFRSWTESFRARAVESGICGETCDRAFRDVGYNARVIENDRNQAEFVRQVWVYLDTAVSARRIEAGVSALRANAPLLEAVEARYGVEKEIVAAIWGLESDYGAARGSFPTIEALATLACDGRRSAFFEAELIHALQILQAGQTTPARLTGSWAGAMGHAQFMPSSYRAHAVDFDGDGRCDIWSDDPADALASAAAYLAHHGWTRGQRWGIEVRVPKRFDFWLSGKQASKPVAEWIALGVRDTAGGRPPDHGHASLLLPAGARGAAFLVYENFRVLLRYNAADAYALAVGHLADRIAGGGPIAAGWPQGDRALATAELAEVQERLTAAGYDTGGVDGIVGPRTVSAVRHLQAALGLAPDGYVSEDILRRLRR